VRSEMHVWPSVFFPAHVRSSARGTAACSDAVAALSHHLVAMPTTQSLRLDITRAARYEYSYALHGDCVADSDHLLS